MNMTRIVLGAVVALTSLFAPAFGASGPVPAGFLTYCRQNPSECRRSKQEIIPRGRDLMADLRRVNSAVNRAITYRLDEGESWDADVRFGDCEDYMLTKRRRLVAMGYPVSALRPAVVTTWTGEYHAVLVVVTENGKFVLDNRRTDIVTLFAMSYRLISVATADSMAWTTQP